MGAGRHGDAEAGVVEDVAGIGAGFADVLGVDPLRGRIVAHAEDQAFHALRAAGDLVDVLQRLDLLDQHLDADAAFEFQLLLQLAQHAVQEQHVGGRVGLGQHDGVEVGAGLFDDADDVVVAPLGGHVVDAHAAGLLAPVEVVEGPGDLGARLHLGAGGDGVFEVAEDVVGGGLGGLLQHLLAAAGDGELRAARAGNTGHLRNSLSL